MLTVASSKEAYFIETTLVEYYKIQPENGTEHEPINARSLQSKEKQPVASSVNKPKIVSASLAFGFTKQVAIALFSANSKLKRCFKLT